MEYSKYKDSLPENTILKLKEIFRSIGIPLKSILNKRLEGIYSAIVYDAENWWSTGGKGTTEYYCLASGYAEAIEHFCNYCAYNYRAVNDKASGFGGFERYPDEKRVTIKEAILQNQAILSDIQSSYTHDGTILNQEKCENSWSTLLESEHTTLTPFYSLKAEKAIYLPDEIISRLSGSTGAGAGNTPYEALSHALDEISERYVKHQIYTKQLTPPTISKDFIKENCGELYHIITQIEKRGYRILVKDASLGMMFPVVSVVIINPKEQSYMVKFGAHYSFQIALERCLTEMFQSYALDSNGGNGHKAFHRICISDDNEALKDGTWFNQLKDDTGAVPLRFFLEEASWVFKPWGINIDYSNRLGVKLHLDHFVSLGCADIFIRDLSFLNFPVYKVYIPHFSHSNLTINEKVVDNFRIANDVIKKILNQQINDITPYAKVLVECFSKESYIGEMILKNVEDSLIEICYAALLYDIGGETSTLKKLQVSNSYARSILLSLKLEQNGYKSTEYLQLFSALVDKKTFEVIRCWKEQCVFVALIRCLAKITNTDSVAIKWKKYDLEALSQTHIRFKKHMLKNVPDQNKIRDYIIDYYSK